MTNRSSRSRVRVRGYSPHSKSAKALSRALGGLVLKTDSSFSPRSRDFVINWGSSAGLDYPEGVLFNGHKEAVNIAQNKLSFFRHMKESGLEEIIPRFWERLEDIPEDYTGKVVARTVLNGHSGNGISIFSAGASDAPLCELYVEYVPKKEEYRVHLGVLSEEEATVISQQQKLRRLDHPDPDWQVRNASRGFIYARQDVSPPPAVVEAAAMAFNASGLDFGAVDVIWNERRQRAYVLEINTAPGLEGTTLEDYRKYFKIFLDKASSP